MKKLIIAFLVVSFLSISILSFAEEVTTETQPKGFTAICTDRAGITMEVTNFVYDFSYHESSRWSSRTSRYTRMFLPFEYKETVIGVPFADIDTVKFTDNEPKENQEVWTALSVKMRDGKELIGKLVLIGNSDRLFTGETEFGDFSLPVEKVAQIVFNREQNKNILRISLGKDDLESELDSEYTISVKTWRGNQIELLKACILNLIDDYKWGNYTTGFDLKIGESTNLVKFDKIKSIQFQKEGDLKAIMTSNSGKTVEISLLDRNLWLGGNWEKFGLSRICITNVASFEIRKTTK